MRRAVKATNGEECIVVDRAAEDGINPAFAKGRTADLDEAAKVRTTGFLREIDRKARLPIGEDRCRTAPQTFHPLHRFIDPEQSRVFEE